MRPEKRSYTPIRSKVALMILALSFLVPTSTQAVSYDVSDIRCLIVAIQMSQSDDDNIKRSGTLSAVYYLGRIDGRSPKIDLASEMRANMKAMSIEESRRDAITCGKVLTERGQILATIGREIQQPN